MSMFFLAINIHTDQNAKVTCTTNVYEKSVMKRKKKGFEYLKPTQTSTMKLF